MKCLSLSLMFATIAVAAPTGVFAQTLPSADVDTVQSGIGEEKLAPIAVKKAPVAVVSVTAPVAISAVSATANVAADPFMVKGVVVTLSGTTGFDRDAALEQAARQALPGVLTSVSIPADKAVKTVKGLGSAMRFVKSYKVVKESLIPVYTLTTDLTFNGPMVLKNFGGKMPVATDTPVAASSTDVPATDGAVPAAANVPVKQWVVRISDRDPAAVDKVRLNLNKQYETRAVYRLLTSSGAELVVDTPLSSAQISGYAGHAVDVVELEVPLPTPQATVTTVDPSGHPWQGQEEPAAPGSPVAPGTPAEPEAPVTGPVGGY